MNKLSEKCVPRPMSGHSRPSHSAPVPTNVRYAPNSDRISRCSELTLCATTGHFRGRSLNVQMQPQTALHAVPATAISLGTTMVDQSVVPKFLGALLTPARLRLSRQTLWENPSAWGVRPA